MDVKTGLIGEISYLIIDKEYYFSHVAVEIEETILYLRSLNHHILLLQLANINI